MTYLCPVYKNVTLGKNTYQWNKKLFLLWENGKMPLPSSALKWVLCLHEGIQLIQGLTSQRKAWKLYWFHMYGRIFTREQRLKKSPALDSFILFKQRIINLWGNEREKWIARLGRWFLGMLLREACKEVEDKDCFDVCLFSLIAAQVTSHWWPRLFSRFEMWRHASLKSFYGSGKSTPTDYPIPNEQS